MELRKCLETSTLTFGWRQNNNPGKNYREILRIIPHNCALKVNLVKFVQFLTQSDSKVAA